MKKAIQTAMLATICAALASCNTFSSDEDSLSGTEPVKDLSGVWVIESAVRNGTDITKAYDFSKFQLHLNTDGSFNIDNYLPFVVKKNGTWNTDDPTHPFHISFREEGSDESTTVELKYPITDGERSLTIDLSPGCYSNTYVYTMKRISE